MDRQIVAICIQETGRLMSGLLSLRSPKLRQTAGYRPVISPPVEEQEKAEDTKESKPEEGTACIPCVNGHFSVCSGLISDEAIRMARRHGIGEEEIRRVNKCLDQLNAMERDDLAVDKIQALPAWEKELAIYAQNESADIRHSLEELKSVDDLESVAVRIKNTRMRVGQEYFKGKLDRLPPEEKARLAEKAIEKLGE